MSKKKRKEEAWVPVRGERVIVPKGARVHLNYPGLRLWQKRKRGWRWNTPKNQGTKARKTYEVTVMRVRKEKAEEVVMPRPGQQGSYYKTGKIIDREVWIAWTGSGRQIKWARVGDLRPAPTPLEMLADLAEEQE
jgi:hypothetical protein